MEKKAFLKVLSGPKEGEHIALDADTMVIGRRQGDIVIPDNLISSKHAKIFKMADGWYIEDLNSTNGLMVDGRLTHRMKLNPGSEITIGNSLMVLFVGTPMKKSPSPIQSHTSPKIELAWLLDEELEPDAAVKSLDNIANDLRVPPNFNADIEVLNGADIGKIFSVNSGTLIIGRLHGEIPLSDPEISRRHAMLEIFSRDMIFLQDLQSTNGTYHNGRNIDCSKMQTTDTIGLGSSLLRLRIKN